MKYIIIILISIIAVSSCSNKQEESNALIHLNNARQHYYANDFEQAYTLLDSLSAKFPGAIKSKGMGRALRDSILRSESSYKIDRIQNEINNYKIAITGLRRAKNNESEIKNIEEKIDSLKKLTVPFRDIINEITTKELQLAARTQCVTCMQQIGK